MTAEVSRFKAVLIIDNPLRDLDGLVMLAWELAQRGGETYLAPMYDQAFVVEAIRPDVVVTNYIRPNNTELLRHYQRRGSRIVVVDTEGVVGQDSAGLAELVHKGGAADLVDLYCVWGQVQYDTFRALGVVPADRLRATGCPRYDFAGSRWRGVLASPDFPAGYVLVNTNMAAIAPRFSRGPDSERAALLSVGMAQEYVDARLRDESLARDGLLALLEMLLRTLPDVQFVLRPHPFESRVPYEGLSRWPNFAIRQQGTSLEWLNASALLLHLNCSTAVEAVMLGREPLMPAWLDTPALHIDGPASVSRQVGGPEQMRAQIEHILAGRPLPADAELTTVRERVIRASYLTIDGRACERIADAIDAVMASAARRPRIPEPPLRFRAVALARRLVGPGAWMRLRSALDPALTTRYSSKALGHDHVADLLSRISEFGGGAPVLCEPVNGMTGIGAAIRIRRGVP